MADHLCPWWVGYLLISPLRKLAQNPSKILGPYLEAGDVFLDVGCAMGFFTLSAAKLVGENGHVIAVDLQERMLTTLKKRAARRGLSNLIEMRTCSEESLNLDGLDGTVDVALAFAVVHEVDSPEAFFKDLRRALVAGGKLLVAEPAGHVTPEAFEKTLEIAASCGFELADRPTIRKSHSALLVAS